MRSFWPRGTYRGAGIITISVQTCQNRLIIRQVIDKSDKYDIIMLVIAVVQEVLRAARPWGYTRGNLTFLAELSRNEQK